MSSFFMPMIWAMAICLAKTPTAKSQRPISTAWHRKAFGLPTTTLCRGFARQMAPRLGLGCDPDVLAAAVSRGS